MSKVHAKIRPRVQNTSGKSISRRELERAYALVRRAVTRLNYG
jgi:hypothetical protein